jgi:hypothetical protein
MNCANHSDLAAVAFCRTCGKPLCQSCTRDVRGVIYCESCLAAKLEGAQPAPGFVPPAAGGFQPVANQTYPNQAYPNQPYTNQPYYGGRGPSSSSGPQPVVAGILAGFFPFGVGAVYCSQYAKGLAHLLIFVLLIFGANHAGNWDWIFGLGIAFFYVYQIIDAIRTAKAIQMGQPVPDPLGLGQTFGAGQKFEPGKVPIGAVVLIGLGLLFLLNTMGVMEHGFDRFWPLIIVFLGGWMFYRHWDRNNRTCTCPRCRTRWLMGPSIVLTTGVLLLLESLDIADLGRTWPAWLLVIGVVKLLQSSASSEGHVGPLPPGPATYVPPTAPGVPPSQTWVAPATVAPPQENPAEPQDNQNPPSSGEVNHV